MLKSDFKDIFYYFSSVEIEYEVIYFYPFSYKHIPEQKCDRQQQMQQQKVISESKSNSGKFYDKNFHYILVRVFWKYQKK